MRQLGLCLVLIFGASSFGQAQTKHWAFQSPIRPAVPTPPSPPLGKRGKGGIWKTWVRNPVDAFLLNALEKRGLSPSPEADKRTLLRRVTFDLTGLPPTPQEM